MYRGKTKSFFTLTMKAIFRRARRGNSIKATAPQNLSKSLKSLLFTIVTSFWQSQRKENIFIESRSCISLPISRIPTSDEEKCVSGSIPRNDVEISLHRVFDSVHKK